MAWADFPRDPTTPEARRTWRDWPFQNSWAREFGTMWGHVRGEFEIFGALKAVRVVERESFTMPTFDPDTGQLKILSMPMRSPGWHVWVGTFNGVRHTT